NVAPPGALRRSTRLWRCYCSPEIPAGTFRGEFVYNTIARAPAVSSGPRRSSRFVTSFAAPGCVAAAGVVVVVAAPASWRTGAAGTTGTAGNSDDGAPDGGEPDAGPPLDADLNPEGGTVLPPYSGGVVNVINASNWNETTIHPFSKRRMLVRDQGDPHLVLL